MRQEIIDKVIAKLKTITVANGFLTDAGKSTAEWVFLSDANPATALQVRDVNCTPTLAERVNSRGLVSKKLELQITYISTETAAQSGLATATVRKVICDVLKAIDSIEWQAGVTGVEEGSNTLVGDQQTKKYIGLMLTVYIQYSVLPFTD